MGTKPTTPILQIAAAAVLLVVFANPLRADDTDTIPGTIPGTIPDTIQTESPFPPLPAVASAQTGHLTWLEHEMILGVVPLLAILAIGAAFWPVVPRRGDPREILERPADIPPLRPLPTRMIRF
jgi:hypothetical protein